MEGAPWGPSRQQLFWALAAQSSQSPQALSRSKGPFSALRPGSQSSGPRGSVGSLLVPLGITPAVAPFILWTASWLQVTVPDPWSLHRGYNGPTLLPQG